MDFGLGFQIESAQPWFWLLALLLPVLWWLSFNSLAGLGKGRRLFSLIVRTLVFLFLIGALAETQWQRKTDKLTVIYLLDQSESIPREKRDYMLTYVVDEVNEKRRAQKKDMAGIIVFGGNAKIESAPYDGSLPVIDRLESTFDLKTETTSLESALKLAKASFPEGTARRVVIISDGNENVGDALSVAQSMSEEGIGIDVIPVDLLADGDVAVEKIVVPSDIRKGQEFDTRVVIMNDTKADESNPDGQVKGRLRITRKTANSEELVSEDPITLENGKNIRGFTSKLDRSAVYTYNATFVPDDDEAHKDLTRQNNSASAFTHVRGKGKVLLIEDAFFKGEFIRLQESLEASEIEVTTINTSELFTSSAALLEYDSVILANLPRASGSDDGGDIQSFSDAQIKMLVDNCEHLGCGIVMLGGDRSFGAGGWSNSELEKAMPVDFQIKNDKVSAVGALALVMHACEMPNGNFWEIKVAEEAIKVLGPMDYCGVVEWSNMGGNPRWLWKLPNGVDRVYNNRNRMLGLINRMTPGDMMDFQIPMKVMLSGLKKVDASMKHAIIISDGDAAKPTAALLRDFVKEGVKVSTVAIGTHGAAGHKTLRDIAKSTGGAYYVVKSPKGLPKIYQREARRVAKPVIKESKSGMNVVGVVGAGNHEIMKGININDFPPFYGYVMSTVKKSNLVDQLMLSSDPKDDNGENSTLLATWRYGNGRTVVFTSDAGFRWTTDWFNSGQYDKLFAQAVRHSMRPITEDANFSVSTEVKDGKARVVVTALDADDDFLNMLEMEGQGIGPGDEDFALPFTQVGPGRYMAETKVEGSGNFLFSIFPGEGYERLTAGFSVPYSSEYSDREANVSLLDSLAKFKPKGGEQGILIDGDLTRSGIEQLLQANTFRPTLTAAMGIQDIWPLLLMLCGTAFFADVFIRRVSSSAWPLIISFVLCFGICLFVFYFIQMFLTGFDEDSGFLYSNWSFLKGAMAKCLMVMPFILYTMFFLSFFLSTDWMKDKYDSVMASMFNKKPAETKGSMSRLQSRKLEIEKQIESRRAATKFAPDIDEKKSGKQALDDILASEAEKTPQAPPKIQRDKLGADEETSYTSRLLDAKRKVQDKRKRNEDPDNKD